ncbi:MAG: single-stranded DNA-binding protein [Eubacterium sp.]|nr:single-stranded DNA-binding protein [Eubacterium sp.]
MNKIVLIGRMVRDPELRTTTTGKSMTRFGVAVERKYKQEGQPTADFIDVVAWGRLAEIIVQYMKKGRRIAINGRLQTGSYTAKDGSKRYVTDVILEEFDFIESARERQLQETAREVSLESTPEFHLIAEDEEVPF